VAGGAPLGQATDSIIEVRGEEGLEIADMVVQDPFATPASSVMAQVAIPVGPSRLSNGRSRRPQRVEVAAAALHPNPGS
jgi:hypothetical protein